MSKIVELTAENVKRLTAVNIKPDGSMVVVGGDHGAGKSSLLDSIMYALAGKKHIPAQPLRRGAKRGRIRMDIGDLIIERTFEEGGKSDVVITSKDGYEAPTPQAILDDMCGALAFDPEEFVRLKPDAQAAMLRELVGIDFSDLDQERAEKYAERTTINRSVKQLEGELKGLAFYGDAPEAEVSVSALATELGRIQRANNANESQRTQLTTANMAISRERSALDGMREEIARMQAKVDGRAADLAKAEKSRDELAATVAKLTDEDEAPIKAKLGTAETTNAHVRANSKRQEVQAKLDSRKEESQELTDRIEAIDQEKADALAKAKFPLPGLGFDDNGVTFDGLPFEQANTGTQIEVSARMGFAMHKDLRVMLIRNGSLLLPEKLAVLGKIAEEYDGQVWIERVGEGQECSVIISDGHVKQHAPELAESAAT